VTRQRTKVFVISLLLAFPPGAAAQAPARLPGAAAIAGEIRDSGSVWGPRIWPGFRPDTIPLLFVIRNEGTALFGWRGDLPEGFGPLADHPGAGWRPEADRGAASTAVELGGRRAAQIVVASGERPMLLGLTLHEAFHVFARSVARPDRRFGRGENSALVASYPVFDENNEAGMALEGRLLGAALRASAPAEARRLALLYSAAREGRSRALTPQMAEFEEMAELNEGLASYTQIRGALLGGAALGAQQEIRNLEDLLGNPERSFRLRYYSTGNALALLLDRLEGSAWKARLVAEDLTLHEALAQATGYHAGEAALRRDAQNMFDAAARRTHARDVTAALKLNRRRQVDSLLARPGVQIELDGSALPQRFIGHCGFDPINTLQVGDGTVLHTRWLSLCAGGNRWRGEFNTPVLQAEGFTTLRAVIGAESEVRVTVAGAVVALADLAKMPDARDVAIESPGLTLRLSRAGLERNGRVLRVVLPAP
jgi:hypothetical protein